MGIIQIIIEAEYTYAKQINAHDLEKLYSRKMNNTPAHDIATVDNRSQISSGHVSTVHVNDIRHNIYSVLSHWPIHCSRDFSWNPPRMI